MTDWRTRAACLDMNPDAFFPRSNPEPAIKRTCLTCPVRNDCLEDALDAGPSLTGIYAGTTQNERRRLLKQRQSHQPSNQATRYTPEDRAKALHLYHQIRPMYSSNTTAAVAIAIARHLGIGSHKTVMAWITHDDRTRATESPADTDPHSETANAA